MPGTRISMVASLGAGDCARIARHQRISTTIAASATTICCRMREPSTGATRFPLAARDAARLELKEPAVAGGSSDVQAFAETLKGRAEGVEKFEASLTKD